MLSAHVPPSTERPILLIMDGCSSHYSEHIYAEAKALNILLQFLPANATHLFQPLDVTVFRPFKQAIRNAVADSIWTDVSTNINKQRAIAIACDVWANSTNEAAIINGFVCTGLCPISLDKMMYRLSLFKPSGTHEVDVNESWLQRRELVRGEVLLLPALKKRKTPARKTLTVSGKFITADYHELLQAQVAAKPKRKKKNSQEHCRNKISPQKKPRRRYTQAVKRAMLSALQSASTRDVEAATGIPKSNLARWANQTTKLLAFDGMAKRFNLDGAGRPEEIPVTAALEAFMHKLRDAERANCGYQSLLKLLQRFCHRHGFTRQKPAKSKKTQADLAAIRSTFDADYRKAFAGFSGDSIINVDETGMTYDMPPHAIWSVRGGTAKIASGEKHSYRMTAVLGARANGE
ncbi:hypothetical protein DYB28_006508 [Aphanomyces astaci]|uniref:DDE-1 domain-containing protein n=1 Tax=Aphanomyces astaci TaxID=112090 RepID=A0A9X8E332_APHAT|nr:hypothetical protein DYB28_006508 [Aphanomyces astaci]